MLQNWYSSSKNITFIFQSINFIFSWISCCLISNILSWSFLIKSSLFFLRYFFDLLTTVVRYPRGACYDFYPAKSVIQVIFQWLYIGVISPHICNFRTESSKIVTTTNQAQTISLWSGRVSVVVPRSPRSSILCSLSRRALSFPPSL